MGEKTAKAQKLANAAYAKVLGAIKNVEAIEKLACEAQDNNAAIAAGEIICKLREVKIMGMQANGLFDVKVKSGGT
mgnify:CR=1 FL=1